MGAPPRPGEWDVFVSHSHTDEDQAARIARALADSGLRVFRAAGAVDAFASISDVVMRALQNSRVLLACYSAAYSTRTACQYEFTTAYLAGQAEGDPMSRLVAINLERSPDHIEPRQLRDTLVPTSSSSPTIEAIADRVAATAGPIGQVKHLAPHWLTAPVYPPTSFTGRWRELWWLHSALHPQVGPLTSPPSTPICVVYGPRGIGKTALAAEYVRMLGGAFPGGVAWRTPDTVAPASLDGRPRLWIIDDARGDLEEVAALLPSEPGTPTLVLTNDVRLAKLGNALSLADLPPADSALLIQARGLKSTGPGVAEICAMTAGSPELRRSVAEFAARTDAETALDRLHSKSSDLLSPVLRWLVPELDEIGEPGWNVIRVLAAASPGAVSILRVADILAATRDTSRDVELMPVQRAVTELLARGVLAAEPDAVDLVLPHAVVLALRRLDENPRRTEHIRSATVTALARWAEPAHRSIRAYDGYSDQEQRAAHRIKTELRYRVTGRPLGAGEGSLRDALTSLHALVQIIRETLAETPTAEPSGNGPRPTLRTIGERLIDDVLCRVLTYWHVELMTHEDLRPAGTTRIAHERAWEKHDGLRRVLTELHLEVVEIVNDLKTITDGDVS
jgi:hypothetical protein